MSYMLCRNLLSRIGLFICLVMAAAGVTADRESHISLAEPLPQPDWELPLIATTLKASDENVSRRRFSAGKDKRQGPHQLAQKSR